jgi:gas vesicle protein
MDSSDIADIAKIAVAAVIGAAIGAFAMFVFDPVSGQRRRALARDKTMSFSNDTAESVRSTARDLGNRAKGMAAEASGAVSNVMQWTGPERRLRPRGILNQAPGTAAQ